MRSSQIIISLLLGSFLFGISPVFAQFYGDVPQERAERQAIDYLTEEGIFQGQGNGRRFDPDGTLNRAEWAVLLTRERGRTPAVEDFSFCFPDVTTQWYAAAVCFAKDQEWVQGFSAGAQAGLYLPANPLTVADILVMLARMQDWPTVAGETWYSGAYEYALQSNILGEAFLPWKEVTRAEAAEILFRSIAIRKYGIARYDSIVAELLTAEQERGDEEDPEDDVVGDAIPVRISPFADQAPESSVARGATHVPVLRFQIEADEEVTLEQLSIRRVSVGRTDNIEYARLLINGKIVKEGNFSGERNHVVWRKLDTAITAKGLLLVEMNIDFIEDALPQLVYQFEVGPENLQFDKAVQITGDELTGETFRIASIPAETVSISNSSKTLRLPYIGEERATIGRFTITAGNHDLLIKRIVLEDAEDLNDRDFSNFRLTAGSSEIGFLASIDRNRLDFTVNDYLLEANKDRTFTVRADIGESVRKLDKIRLYMEEDQDLHALDFDFQFGVRVTNDFTRENAWCVGSNSPECPTEGFRKRCSKEDIEFEVRDCEIIEEEESLPEECDDRVATVCGITTEETEDSPAIKESFQNRCLAEKAGATGILPGPCEE